MREYAKKFCEDERVVDGFILKSESPSCGFRRTKIWKDSEKPQIDHMGAGFFGRKIKKEFSHLPIINEGMLRNERLRSNFLTQTFCIAEFRKMRENPTKKSLIEFQTKHKLLFMAYDQERMKKMGRIVGNQAKKPLEDVMEEYSKLFYQLINKIPSYRSHVNVIQHALGYFKNKISSQEKEFFLAELERYENGVVNLNTIIHLIREWIIRFQEDYLANQSYFQPYPEDLDFRAYSVSNKQKDKLRRRR